MTVVQGQQFKLPDVGEGLTEAEILTWHVAVGDVVSVNDTLVEVETAKASVELPSPYAGIVTALHVGEGDTVEVGTPIITISDTADRVAHPIAPAENARANAPAAAGLDDPPEAPVSETQSDGDGQSVLVGYGPSRAAVTRRTRKRGNVPRPAMPIMVETHTRRASTQNVTREPAHDEGPLHAQAHANGANLATRPDDSVSWTTGQPASAPTETRTPIKSIRKRTAEAMVLSAFSAPHVTEWVTVDMTRSLKLLEKMRADKSFADVRLSPLLLVIRATLLSLARNPEANAKWDDTASEIVQFHDVNLGIATATPRGLLVPNIRSAQALSTPDLAIALQDLILQARAGKARVEAMQKGTFTITNIGVFDVDGGTPILNPGEAMILCVGAIRRQPWQHKGRIKLRNLCTLALSFDHRLIDGELGSRVLADIARFLQDPALALTV